MQFIGAISKNTQPSLEVKSLPEKQSTLNYLPLRRPPVVGREQGKYYCCSQRQQRAIHTAVNIYFVVGEGGRCFHMEVIECKRGLTGRKEGGRERLKQEEASNHASG